jgi:hypothetical protein
MAWVQSSVCATLDLKERFVTKRVHLKLSTEENSFDLELGEAGGGQNFGYLRKINGESQLNIHVTVMNLYLCLRISIKFFRCDLPFFRAMQKKSRKRYYKLYTSAPVQTGPGAHSASCTMGTGSFPGVNCGRSVLLTTHRLLVLRSWKSRARPLSTL